jgi:hypothetical protein
MAFRSKKPATLEERLNATSATKAAALSVFEAAAADLQSTADEAHALRLEIVAEISRLHELEAAVYAERQDAKTKAALIRESFLG